MYLIGKKDRHEAYVGGQLTRQLPTFIWQLRSQQFSTMVPAVQPEPGVMSSALQQLVQRFAAQECEVITLALRHAQSSGSFFDRMRGRYRQLLLPLQTEAHRAIQFLVLQALTAACETHPEIQTLEPLVRQIYDSSTTALHENLADYFARPTAPGEVFAHKVWELIHGPREKERFAVFALRMESCFRRLLADMLHVLDALTTTVDGVVLGTSTKGE